MSDILIRGMEMPKDCGKCFVGYRTICADGCVLVELPEHGDLIDICNAENALFVAGNYHLNDYRQGWNDGIKAVIENAPVIVPASKEETE